MICAPVFTQSHGLPTQIAVGATEGLKHDSSIQCDGLMSLEKSRLTDYVGELGRAKPSELDGALVVALGRPARARELTPLDRESVGSRRFTA